MPFLKPKNKTGIYLPFIDQQLNSYVPEIYVKAAFLGLGYVEHEYEIDASKREFKIFSYFNTMAFKNSAPISIYSMNYGYEYEYITYSGKLAWDIWVNCHLGYTEGNSDKGLSNLLYKFDDISFYLDHNSKRFVSNGDHKILRTHAFYPAKYLSTVKGISQDFIKHRREEYQINSEHSHYKEVAELVNNKEFKIKENIDEIRDKLLNDIFSSNGKLLAQMDASYSILKTFVLIMMRSDVQKSKFLNDFFNNSSQVMSVSGVLVPRTRDQVLNLCASSPKEWNDLLLNRKKNLDEVFKFLTKEFTVCDSFLKNVDSLSVMLQQLKNDPENFIKRGKEMEVLYKKITSFTKNPSLQENSHSKQGEPHVKPHSKQINNSITSQSVGELRYQETVKILLERIRDRIDMWKEYVDHETIQNIPTLKEKINKQMVSLNRVMKELAEGKMEENFVLILFNTIYDHLEQIHRFLLKRNPNNYFAEEAQSSKGFLERFQQDIARLDVKDRHVVEKLTPNMSSLKDFQKENSESLHNESCKKTKDPLIFSGKGANNLPRYIGALPKATNLTYFEEHQIIRDGACGFHALGVSRKEVGDLLLQHAQNEELRKKLAPEIRNALYGNDLGYAATDYSRLLYKEYMECSDLTSRLEGEANAIIKKAGSNVANKNLRNLISYFKQLNKKEYRELLIRLEVQLNNEQRCEDKMNQYSYSELAYRSYVNSLARNAWLGYESAKLVAELRGINLYIWSVSTQKPGTIELRAYGEAAGNKKVIHMLHTDEFRHFNLLSELDVNNRSHADMNKDRKVKEISKSKIC